MYIVSDAWKEKHKARLLPESFVEISVGVADVEVRDLVNATSASEAIFSNISNVVGDVGTPRPANYATLEHNLWTLDGSRGIIPDSAPYDTPGYVSADDSHGSVTLKLSEVRNVPIPGFTITWSSEYGEYPTDFSVEVKRGDAVIASIAVADNDSVVTEVPLDVTGYDTVVVRISNWSVPNHRIRIDRIYFGHVISFGKRDILSYSHEQHGNLNSAELPKNNIDFSLDNVDGKWNPSNPTGMEKYLSERQVVNVRYGMRVNGVTEWIKAGTFYLSEWRTPSNGLAAYFSARDAFEYMLNEPYKGITSGTLSEIIQSALASTDMPDSFSAYVDSSLNAFRASVPEGNHTVANVLQMCANAGCCVMYQDREGALHIEPLNKNMSDYVISSFVSYSQPEVELSKPLKAVSVEHGDKQTYVLDVAGSGETQTVTNKIVATVEQAEQIAAWVRDTLEPRKSLTGEFRADPRLDLFDIVTVESKYGEIAPVAITNIKYAYSGSFNASYAGRVIVGNGT